MLEQRTFSTNDLMFMSEAGMFLDRKVELIEGVIYNMPASPQHEFTIDVLSQKMNRVFIDRTLIRIQNGLDIGKSDWLPHPDVMLVIPKNYSQARPVAEDVLLLIEVSLSTLQLDLNEELAAYAKAGIKEYWVADLANSKWIVHNYPSPSLGNYSSVKHINFGQAFAPLAFPDDTHVWLDK